MDLFGLRQLSEMIEAKGGAFALDYLLLNTAPGFWNKSGFLTFISGWIPEVYSLTESAEAGPHHREESTYSHTVRVIKNLPKNALLRRAALFHDTGKASVCVVSNSKGQYHGHAEKSAEITSGVMARLGYGREETQKTVLLVKNHMRPVLYNAPGTNGWSDRAVRKLVKDTNGMHGLLIRLALADVKGMSGTGLDTDKTLRIMELKKRIERVIDERE